ncbi:MAG TPA: ABC transporter permease [Nocardioidaceae bacterium]|nr:ABC transporter permease [Nocardioidaceae bacterium]
MSTTQAPVAAVRLPTTGLRHQLRATSVVWRRELVRFMRDRTRALTGLVQPLLFLFVLGTGLSSLVSRGTDIDFRTFLYPGIVAISVLFTATFAGISLVWDREWGFLREMMVAPVSRASILVGKALGGATVATAQSMVMLALCGVVDIPYDPVMLVEMVVLLFLAGLMLTAMSLAMVVRIRQFQAAFPLVQMVITPMMFLSGAMFPLSGLPRWLDILTTLNPLTYAVEPMRHVVFAQLSLSASDQATLDPGLTWGDWQVPVPVQVGVVVVVTIGLLALAIARFDRTE